MSDMTSGTHRIDTSKRTWLIASSCAGVAGGVATAIPFVSTFQPSEKAKAAGAAVEVDISGLKVGEKITVEWRGKPVWILKRSPEQIAELPKLDGQLADPLSKRHPDEFTPKYAQNEHRSIKPDVLVVVGICTHLGCSPTDRFQAGPQPSLPNDWEGGFLCPCHGSTFDARQAKDWFGTTPPDLTLVARSRAGHGGTGADYLYTYLRTYYRDETKATGWNNLLFPSVAMPNPLWELQGERRPVYTKVEQHGHETEVFKGWEQVTPGTMTPVQFDNAVGDLVSYLQWMAEPAQNTRVRIGVWVLLFLAMSVVFVWRLNASYWKDVK